VKRCQVGEYEVTATAGEEVRAFIPAPLPPEPAVDIASLQPTLAKALVGLGRLDGLARVLPNTLLFLYSYVRKEAVLSSQIEGTQSSISDLMLFETNETPGALTDDVVEVSNYVRALEHGLDRIADGFPLSNRLLREIHGELLSRGRGSDKMPGEFRKTQNWIGGSRPGTAHFVPPPPYAIQDCMSDLERFLHEDHPGIDPLLRAGITHLQFETIHPFLDGNGRVGRLLIALILCHDGVLRHPLLYLSLYFKQNREQYYDLLDIVRRTGDWEEWLNFYLEGVAETAEAAVSTAERLLSLFDQDAASIQRQGRAAGSALRVHQALKERPITSLRDVSKSTGLSLPAAASGMGLLEHLGVTRELTGQARDRRFAYYEYLAILNEGTEPI
jgi:Fic family protein